MPRIKQTNAEEENIELEEIIEEVSDDLVADDTTLDFLKDQTEQLKEIKEDDIVEEDVAFETVSERLKQSVVTVEENDAAAELHSNFMDFLVKTKKMEICKENKMIIPTGIDLLDTILGGGLGTNFNMFVGFTASGKSAISAKIISTGQKLWPGKFMTVYLDTEEATTTERLAELGVRHPKIEPVRGLTIEKLFSVIDSICVFKEEHPEYMTVPTVVVWDSIANTITEAAMNTDNPAQVLGEKARKLSLMLPKYVNHMNKYCIAMIAVNQLRDKIDIGIFKSPSDVRHLGDKVIPGGQAVTFNAFNLLHFRNEADLKGEYGFDGIRVAVKTLKTKRFAPFIDIKLVFSFKNGFSNFWTNYELLKQHKRITAGAWTYLNDIPTIKFRQKEATEHYKTNTEWRKAFDDNVKDVLQKEYIEKYKPATVEDGQQDEFI